MDRNTMNIKQRLSFGIGHVLNDVCASMWFTYLLVFFHLVLQFDSIRAGAILLIGQIADALSTPFVGIFSDSNDDMWLCRYGRRKAWHLIGTVCVICSFPFIFHPCLKCEHSSPDAQMVYYAAFVIIFQFGWASVQISHLALIPELTYDEHHRTHLTSIRSFFTVLSNILVYVATYVSLQMTEGTDPEDQIGPANAINFERVVYFGVSFGIVASVLFHLGVKEGNCDPLETRRRSSNKSVKEFLRDSHLYQVALVYMCSRLFVNLGQVFIPLYLHETLGRSAKSLALVPLLMYLSSLIATLAVHPMNRFLGRGVSFIIGATIGVSGCIWVRFGSGLYFNEYEIYLVAALLGFGGSIMLVTTLGITADLIGHDTDSGAFVYGSMSFFDKLSNGLAVMIIQHLASGYADYYRDVLAYVCGGAAVIGLLPLYSLRKLSLRYSAQMIEPIIDDASSINSQLEQPLVH